MSKQEKIQRLGAFVHEFRMSQQPPLSFPEIRRRGGPSVGWLGELESGAMASEPKPDTLKKLAQALGVPYETLERVKEGQNPIERRGPDVRTMLARISPGLTSAAKLRPPGGKSRSRFAQWVEKQRHAIGDPSLVELGRMAKLDPQIFVDIEAGYMPQPQELKKLAKLFGVTAAELQRIAQRPTRVTNNPLVLVQPSENKVKLPVYDIACGEPLEIPDHAHEFEEWDVELVVGTNAIFRVRGDSMIGCGYQPGDLLFVRHLRLGEKPKHGDKVVAVVENGVTCKIYRNDELGEYLESAPADGASWKRPIRGDMQLIAVVKRRLTNE